MPPLPAAAPTVAHGARRARETRLRAPRARRVVEHMRSPTRIALRGHERHGDELWLIFGIDDGRGEMTASVPVRSGAVLFPHGLTDSGESLGPVTDAALRERAEQTVAVLEAAATYSAIRWSRRRRRTRA